MIVIRKKIERLCLSRSWAMGLLCVGVFLGACSAPALRGAQPKTALANPASENCIMHGGKLVIRKRGDGGEYGLCTFEDNKQCEEWAMLRGACRAGGIKITGYATPAAQYCAVSGGAYRITSGGNADQEQGLCVLDGKICDAVAYFNGRCDINH